MRSVIVPFEPTEEMRQAGIDARWDHNSLAADKVAVIYRAMLAAAPPPPVPADMPGLAILDELAAADAQLAFVVKARATAADIVLNCGVPRIQRENAIDAITSAFVALQAETRAAAALPPACHHSEEQMSVVVVTCPKCGSVNCSPTFYTDSSFDCMACDNEFDLATPAPPPVAGDEAAETDYERVLGRVTAKAWKPNERDRKVIREALRHMARYSEATDIINRAAALIHATPAPPPPPADLKAEAEYSISASVLFDRVVDASDARSAEKALDALASALSAAHAAGKAEGARVVLRSALDLSADQVATARAEALEEAAPIRAALDAAKDALKTATKHLRAKGFEDAALQAQDAWETAAAALSLQPLAPADIEGKDK